jgi:alpha-galactosidase/6-phospho-beta-glucosidase family protein
MANITVIGSSYAWSPTLLTDLMSVFDEPLEVRMLDLDEEPARLCSEWGSAASARRGRKDRFLAFTDRAEALRGADAVLITISTGGLAAMRHDIEIPDRYGISSTVGDTAGPGGWSRALRNIPVFRRFAEDFSRFCPTAIVANYTNPLSALTAVLCRECPNPVVGLCHAYFEIKDVIASIFGLADWGPIGIEIAGMNHFTWVTDFRIGREPGYPLLRRKIGSGSLDDVIPRSSRDEIGYRSGHRLCVELYDHTGYLPYPADRHTAEFVSFALAGNPERTTVHDADGSEWETVGPFATRRTSIDYRVAQAADRRIRLIEATADIASGRVEPPQRSRETGAEMIAAYLANRPFCDAVNTLNVGQIPGLPSGACVETLGVVDGLGVRPLAVRGVPQHLLELMRPQAVNQAWLVEGALTGRDDLAMQALANDPLCRALRPADVRAMGRELMDANRASARADD